MDSSCATSQWNMSRGKFVAKPWVFSLFAFAPVSWVKEQILNFSSDCQIPDYSSMKKNVFPRTFFSLSTIFSELKKKRREGGMIERYSGFNKRLLCQRKGGVGGERKPLRSNSFWNIPTGRKQLLWFSLLMLYTQKMF